MPKTEESNTKEKGARNTTYINTILKPGVSRRLRSPCNSNRRGLTEVRTRRCHVGRRWWLVKAGRQAKAVVDLDLEGQTTLALSAVLSIGVEIVWTFDSQRHRYGQRFTKCRAATAVLDRVIIQRIVRCAAPKCALVVGLDHRLIRVRVENCTDPIKAKMYDCNREV